MQLQRRHRRGAAYIVAVLSFVLAQLAAAAHAEDCHDDHDAGAPCAICCLAVTDHDDDASRVDVLLDLNRTAERNATGRALEVGPARPEALGFVRGPP